MSAINGQWAEKKLLKYLTAQREQADATEHGEFSGLAKQLAKRKHPSNRKENASFREMSFLVEAIC